MNLTIWCNAKLSDAAMRQLTEGALPHRVVRAASTPVTVLAPGAPEPALAAADVAFGQPEAAQCAASPRLRWIEISTAGYTRYDHPEFLETLAARGTTFTNASHVFADACAQQVLAMMLALGRQLLSAHGDQLTDRAWQYPPRSYHTRLLTGQTVLLLGYGAIGRRLAELLAPFGVTLLAVRRKARSERGVRIVPGEGVSSALAQADHVVDILPDNDSTRNFVNARRLACMKPGAIFYNVGRGPTVDQAELLDALHSGRLGAAYLDVTMPEPLPPEHPLWAEPNCFITPHVAGRRHDRDEVLVRHFLANLAAFESGKSMTDRVI